VWDTQAGRLIKDGWRHEQRITGIEFNPAEFLLATSSADRTVRVWDLETWEQVDALGPEATGVQAISYHKDGSALLSATADALKVWGLDPTVHHDTVPMDWRHLADMHISYKDDHPRAVGCCLSGNAVGVFVVDLRKVAPFCAAAGASKQAAAAALPAAGGGGALGLVSGAATRTSAPLQQQQLGGAIARAVEQLEGPAIAGPLTRQLPRHRTPPAAAAGAAASCSDGAVGPRPGSGGSSAVQHATPPTIIGQPGQLVAPVESQAPPQHKQHVPSASKGDFFPDVEIRVPPRRLSAATPEQGPAAAAICRDNSSTRLGSAHAAGAAPAAVETAAPISRGAIGSSSSSSSSRRAVGFADAPPAGQQPPTQQQLVAGMAGLQLQHDQAPAARQPLQHSTSSSSSSSSSRRLAGATAANGSAVHTAAAASAPASRGASRGSSAVASRAALAHDLAAGLPRQQEAPAPPQPPADPILAAMAARPLLKSDLARMVSAVMVAKGFAARGNLEGAYKAALSHGDAATACVLLEAVAGRPDAFELGSLEPLIKLLELTLASGHEAQLGVGLATLALVLRGPGHKVAEVCGAPAPAGVDLSFEARRSKCLLIKMALEGLGLTLGVLGRGAGSFAARAQLLAEELRRIVAAGR
jgi:hypothetical protein